MLTFAFMHHPYLVCILFGMPSLHLFTFLMFFIFLYSLYFVCDPWHNGVERINKSLSGVGIHKICSD